MKNILVLFSAFSACFCLKILLLKRTEETRHNISSYCKVYAGIMSIDGLHLFWIPRKIVHAHISGRQNKNELKEKHTESSEHPLNRVPTSFVSVDFKKTYARQLRSICMYKLKVDYYFTILLHTFSETISWARNNKMGHC